MVWWLGLPSWPDVVIEHHLPSSRPKWPLCWTGAILHHKRQRYQLIRENQADNAHITRNWYRSNRPFCSAVQHWLDLKSLPKTKTKLPPAWEKKIRSLFNIRNGFLSSVSNKLTSSVRNISHDRQYAIIQQTCWQLVLLSNNTTCVNHTK